MIEFALDGHVATLTLSRPPANAFTADGLQQLRDLVAKIDANPEIRAVVVTGAGEKFFSAGADLNGFADGDRAHARAMAQQFGSAFEALQNARAVVIAAINGYAMGGGLECALACDIRIATADVKFGFPIARTLGNCLSIANLSRLERLMGAGRVMELILTARLVRAEEALACGLVSEIVDDHAALTVRAQELADTLAAHAPITMRATKEGLRRLRIDGATANDRDLIIAAYMSQDFKEGMEAFLSKRKPVWKGR